MKRLTKLQLELLRNIEHSPRHVGPYYQPAIKIVGLGLAEWRGKYLRITESGKSAIEDSRKDKTEQGVREEAI